MNVRKVNKANTPLRNTTRLSNFAMCALQRSLPLDSHDAGMTTYGVVHLILCNTTFAFPFTISQLLCRTHPASIPTKTRRKSTATEISHPRNIRYTGMLPHLAHIIDENGSSTMRTEPGLLQRLGSWCSHVAAFLFELQWSGTPKDHPTLDSLDRTTR